MLAVSLLVEERPTSDPASPEVPESGSSAFATAEVADDAPVVDDTELAAQAAQLVEEDADPTLVEFALEDYDFKINALISSFSDGMRDIIAEYREKKRIEREEEEAKRKAVKPEKKIRRGQLVIKKKDDEVTRRKEEQRIESEALAKGVDMEVLREIRVAFEEKKTLSGGEGVDEEEFLELFGPSLCKGKSEEETRHWFRAIDQNCSGSIQWDEVSNYLVNYHVYAEKMKTIQEDYFVAKSLEPKGQLTSRKHHRLPIHKIIYSQAVDMYYSACNDGLVLAWDPASLKASHTVHRSTEGVWVYDIVFLPSNRLIVLQSDRCFFVYDCFISQDVLRHELFRVFATSGSSTKTLSDGSTYYEQIDRKKILGDAARTVDRSSVSDRVMPNMIPATYLQASKNQIRCLDHLSTASSGIGSGEPIVCGTDTGELEFYVLQPVASAPIAPVLRISIHTAMITSIKYAPELNGCITSSLDGTIAVTDIEIRQVVQRLEIHDTMMAKPQHSFEYKTYHNMLLSWTSRTLHVWNALTGARLTQLTDHEAPIVAASINVDRMLAYVLLESKVIRVWNLRNWRRVGDYVDEKPRYCNDTLNFLMWSPRHHYLLAGCSELFALRPRDVQERIDAGLTPSNRNYIGHLHPIRDAKPIDHADHIVAVDTHEVVVWGVQTRKLLAKWKWRDPEDNVMCFARAPDNVRVAIGTESGTLEMYNYACGYKIFSMLHDARKMSSVNAVIFLECVQGDGPPSCIAAIGPSIYSWVTERENEDDLDPVASFHHIDPEVHTWCLTCIDKRRQTLAASYSNGEIRILSAASLICVTTLSCKSPGDRLLSFADIPSLFASAHSDGTVRMLLYESGSPNLHILVSFHGAYANEETVSCMVSDEGSGRLILGDSVGIVSVFSMGRLFDRQYVWQELMPNLHDPFFLQKLRNEVIPEIELLGAFDAHVSIISSVSVVNGALVTSGGDRHLRSWNLDTLKIAHEFGADANDTDTFLSFDLTQQHHFNAVDIKPGNEVETGIRGISRALSYTKRGSILAVEMRRVRLLQADREGKKAKLAAGLPLGSSTEEQEAEDLAILSMDDAEFEAVLKREPSALISHRRKVSAVVGDFVARDNPASLATNHTEETILQMREAKRLEEIDEQFKEMRKLGVTPPTKQVAKRNETSKMLKKGALVVGTAHPAMQLGLVNKANMLRARISSLNWTSDLGPAPLEEPGKLLLPPIRGALPSSNLPPPSQPFATTSVSRLNKSGEVKPLDSALFGIPRTESIDRGRSDSAAETLVGSDPSAPQFTSPTRAAKLKVSKYRVPIALSLDSSLLGGATATSPTKAPPTQNPMVASTGALPTQKSSAQLTDPKKESSSNNILAGIPVVVDEVQLFKIATDHVLRHQTNLTRTIPDKGMHSKLQEVMRIRQERQEINDQTTNQQSGIFYRLPLLPMVNGGLGPPVEISRQSEFDLLLGGQDK